MKKTVLFVIITFLFAITKAFGQENKGVVLSGNWSYNIDYAQKVVHITGAKIENKSTGGKSGTLKLKLYLTNTKYSGGSISGYVLAEYTFDQLEGGYYYHDIDKRLDFYSTPPDGNYYLTLCLCEYEDGYYIKDYLNFDNLATIDNSVERLNTLSNALNEVSNTLNNGNNYNYNNSNNNSSRGHLSQVTCSFCNGTGKNPAKEYPAEFGHGHTLTNNRCEICGSYENHYHKMCPSCLGKGYTQKYVP